VTAIGRTVQRRECALPSCPVLFETPHGGSWHAAYCSPACLHASKGMRPAKPRAAIVTRPAQKRPRAISPASPEQRAKIRGLGKSIVSGATTGLQPAHLTARGRGGCDSPLCTVPLTAAEHRAFDDGQLDILGALQRDGLHVEELCHALRHYDGNLPALLQRLTGVRWAPVREPSS
jgi:hypothetical protein